MTRTRARCTGAASDSAGRSSLNPGPEPKALAEPALPTGGINILLSQIGTRPEASGGRLQLLCRPLPHGVALALGFAQAVKPFLHVGELPFEIIDFAARTCGFFSLARLGLPPRKWCKHRKSPLEHFHVMPHLVFQRGERADPECLTHLLAKL